MHLRIVREDYQGKQVGYTKVKFLVDEGLAERKTAASYLKAFEKIGLLESRKVGKENLYLNKRLYKLLSGPPG